MDASNITEDTSTHAFSAQRENANTIFTSENIEKSNKLLDEVKNLTINNAKYYESNISTSSDAQGNLKSIPEIVTHTINGIYDKKLLSCRNIPILTSPTSPGIVTIRLIPQTLLMAATIFIFKHSVGWRMDSQNSMASNQDGRR